MNQDGGRGDRQLVVLEVGEEGGGFHEPHGMKKSPYGRAWAEGQA